MNIFTLPSEKGVRNVEPLTIYEMCRELQTGGNYLSIEFWSAGHMGVWYKDTWSPSLTDRSELEDYIFKLVLLSRMLFRKF